MSLKRFFALCMTVTIFALIYIQMQVAIYDLAYRGKQREDQVFKLADSNTHAAVNIARLKSAQNLGSRFFDKNEDVDFVDHRNIVDVEASPAEFAKVRLASGPVIARRAESLFDRVFGLRSIAEAKPIR